jgi:phage minor structural protein
MLLYQGGDGKIMSYQIWLFDQTGNKVAVLQNAFNVRRKTKANCAPTLSFTIPADDEKTVNITSSNEAKIWNTKKSRFEGLYCLDDATDRWGSSEKFIDCNYTGAIVRLEREKNISYDTTVTPKTPTQVITGLLALQQRTPAITVGTIEPITSFAFAIENANLLTAIFKLPELLGGYIEVDESRALNWWNEPTGSPTREIRYQKQLKSMTRKVDHTTIINRLYAYGYGEGDAQLKLTDAGEAHEYIETDPAPTAATLQIDRITDLRITHPSTLLLWAQRVLAEYSVPIYSYTVDIVNLAEHKDYNFDLEDMTVGAIVRVVNPDLIDSLTGTAINVNVKVVSVDTDLSKPESITLELANATKSLADLIGNTNTFKNIAENVACRISAGNVVVLGTFTVQGWATAGQTTIDGGNITTNTITADAIKTSTLNAKTITLGTTGGDSIIKSGNYSAGSAGWQIKANGDAEFNNVTVRGTIATTTLSSGSTLTIGGTMQSANYDPGSAGWQIDGDGFCTFVGAISCWNIDSNGTVEALRIQGTSWVVTDTYFGFWEECAPGDADINSLYVYNNHLCFKNYAGTSYTLI